MYHREKSFLAPPELAKIHPLGKSPVVTIAAPGVAEPITLAESPFIVQYLSEHFPKGQDLVPKRWKDGQEGKIGGETGQWMRYQYLMYFSEGSFMAALVRYFIMSGMFSPPPFLSRHNFLGHPLFMASIPITFFFFIFFFFERYSLLRQVSRETGFPFSSGPLRR